MVKYFFNDKLAVTPSFIFYFPDNNKTTSSYTFGGTTYTITTEAKSSLWEFNADVNYYFVDDAVKLYGIAGLNLSGTSYKYSVTDNDPNTNTTSKSSGSNTEAGINLGIGVDFKAGDKVIPFVQAKYTVSDYDQLVLKGGVRIPLK